VRSENFVSFGGKMFLFDVTSGGLCYSDGSSGGFVTSQAVVSVTNITAVFCFRAERITGSSQIQRSSSLPFH
jgi:hypothetical protein